MTAKQVSRRQRREARTAELHSERAYSLVRNRILTMEYPPGAALSEATLRVETGIGRTPIREALQRLANEDLVQIFPRKGTFVKPLQLSDIRHVYELRLELEGLAGRWAASRITPQQMEQMHALLAKVRDPGTCDFDATSFDAQFHALIGEASHNPYLQDMLSRLYVQSMRLLHLTNQSIGTEELLEARPEYAAIVEAVCSNESERAEQLLRQHVQRYTGRILGYLMRLESAPAPSRDETALPAEGGRSSSVPAR